MNCAFSFRSTLFVLLLAVLAPLSARASTWTGSSGNWSSNGNPGWNGTGVPNAQGAIAAKTDALQATTNQDIAAGVTVGTLSLSGSTNISWTFTLVNSITFNQDGAGAGAATISNTNSFAGVANALTLGNASTQAITLADDLLISNTGGSTNPAGAIQIGGKIGGTGNITLSNIGNSASAGYIRIQNGGNNFTGTVLVQKGATTFNMANSFGGVAGNTITLGQSGQGSATLVSTAGINVPNNVVVASGSGGTLILGSTSTSNFTGYSGTLTLNGDVSLTSLSTVGTNTLTFSGAVSGNGGITKIGTGAATLSSGSNSYGGGTTVSQGALNVAATSSLGAMTGSLAVSNPNSGAGTVVALTLNSAQTVGSLSGTIAAPSSGANSATINLTGVSTALTVNQSGNSSFVGMVAGSGALTKNGAGSLTLSGNNSYTGLTQVNGGTLLVNGNQSSATGAVSVTNANSTLGGIGTIGGSAAVNAGASITGATNGTIGTLTVSGANSVTFTGASGNLATYLADLGSGINNSDRIAVGGAVDLSSSFDQLMFQGSADGTSSYVLATYGSHNSVFNTVTNLPLGYQLIYNSTELDLIPLAAVPEPGTWLAGGLALGALLGRPVRWFVRLVGLP
jgi:autotransporter-associated beta strand protein